jgi:signal transduction histidine kinase
MAHSDQSLARQRRELFLLYLGSLGLALVTVALVVRGVTWQIELAETRSQLALIGEDLASPPVPGPGREREWQKSRRDFRSAHIQVEWFTRRDHEPVARLGDSRNMGHLPPENPSQANQWQQGPGWIALVIAGSSGNSWGNPSQRVWLRISGGLEPMEGRLRQLDLTLSAALLIALLISAGSSWILTQKAVAPVEATLERLRQFSLDASHELRGPLAAMAANAEMGLVETLVQDRAQRRRFEAIASASEQMRQLVDDLLLLAKNEEHRLGQAERLDLSELLEQELDLQQDLFAQKQIQLVADIVQGIQLCGHRPLLHRLLRNLLDNARRYTEPGGTVRVSGQQRGRVARISIHDTGVGLNPDQQARVFDRFWRARHDRADGGSGLGLTIAARICNLHGGRIQLSSEPGAGSCFEVHLPALAGPSSAVSQSS